jgi:hypothetical protein
MSTRKLANPTEWTAIVDPKDYSVWIDEIVCPKEERVTFQAQKRVNKATLASRPLEAIKDDLTSFFASHLVRQMMEAGVLRVSSEVSKATGAVTFTAELVCLKEEKQNNATTTKTTKDSSD